jgi:hypothetical protein
MKTQFRSLSIVTVLLILGGLAATLTAGTICPAVGVATAGTGVNAGTGCFVLFTYSTSPATGALQITRTIDPTVLRYDSIDGDDVTVGIKNNVLNSAAPFFITELDLTPTNPFGDFSGPNIFNFDGDGICGAVVPTAPGCPFSPIAPPGTANSYSGPLSTFQTLTTNSGKVFFSGPGVAPGSSTFFSLEDVPGGGGGTPEPMAVVLVGSGLLFLGLLRRKRV